MKRNNKGFTIVELVIVIAVIAILASVLVPTFSGIVLKAQRSADTQVVRMLNEDVSLDISSKGLSKHDTIHQAIQACVEQGMSPDKITAKSDYKIAWESTTGRFVLIDLSTNNIMYPEDNNYNIVNINGRESEYFVPTTYDENIQKGTFKYSIYAYGNDWPSEVIVNTGIDTGNVSNIEKITIDATSINSDMIIHTTYFDTKVEIKNFSDSAYSGKQIKHYGYSYLVDINNISDNYYLEYGEVARLELNQGTAFLEKNSVVYCAMAETALSNIIVEDGFVSFDEENIKAVDPLITADKDLSGIANTQIADCGYGNHVNKSAIYDQSHVYFVCTCCGYTLIDSKTKDENINVIYHTSTNTTEKVDDSTNPKGKYTDTLVEAPKETYQHKHNVSYQYKTILVHEVSCDICGLVYEENHDYDENGVCKICNQKISLTGSSWNITSSIDVGENEYLFYYDYTMKMNFNKNECDAIYNAASYSKGSSAFNDGILTSYTCEKDGNWFEIFDGKNYKCYLVYFMVFQGRLPISLKYSDSSSTNMLYSTNFYYKVKFKDTYRIVGSGKELTVESLNITFKSFTTESLNNLSDDIIYDDFVLYKVLLSSGTLISDR